MKQRLSAKKTVFHRIPLTLLLFAALMIVGFFELVLIKSSYEYFTLFQRLIHLVLCYYLVRYFLKEKIYLEYDEQNLYVVDASGGEVREVPLSKIYHVEMLRKIVKIDQYSFRFSLHFYDETENPSEVTFEAYPGQHWKTFIDCVEKSNNKFDYKNWVLFS
jgi:hypothetical protein